MVSIQARVYIGQLALVSGEQSLSECWWMVMADKNVMNLHYSQSYNYLFNAFANATNAHSVNIANNY